MSRIAPPSGYLSWNTYSNDQADASLDQSITARRLIKRNIKLNQIASEERYAGGDTTSPSWRVYNDYETPGTVSPATGRPWLTDATDALAQFQMEGSTDTIATENNKEITAEGGALPVIIQRSLAFNGSTSFVEVFNTTTDWNLQLSWTVEFWSKATRASDGNLQTVISQYDGGSDRLDVFYQSGSLCVNNARGAICAEPTPGVWTHVALVCTGGGGTDLKVYYNGTNVYTGGGYYVNAPSSTVVVGKRGQITFQYFNGKIANVRISNIPRYSATFSPSLTLEIDANVKLALDGELVDTSASAHTITNNGASVDTDFPT